jgi:ornithine cyclodeaminase
MIDYIGVGTIRALLEEIGVANFIEQLANEIEADYRRWGAFEKSARLASHSRVGVIELMPISDDQRYSFKYVNGHPCNTSLGLLTVTAFGVLAAVETGYPLLLSELTVTTALRTAATSALVARWLARRDGRSMALIGSGAQSEFQAIAFHRMLGIRELRIFDVDPLAMVKLEHNLHTSGELADLAVIRSPSAAEAARGADIVTTVTADKRNAIIVENSMVARGMHLNAVGGDCPGKTELQRDILTRPDCRIFVEYEPQSRIEGEIQQLPADFPITELAQVFCGAAPGRRSDEEVTLFDSVGFALEDYSALRFLYGLLPQFPHLRQQLDLIPDLDDPKDLLGGVLGSRGRARIRRVA